MSDRPLDGVTVVDLTRYGPGPWCAMLLGDLGADVVKVEARGGGAGRSHARLVGDGGVFTDWMDYARRNSRSLGVDLKQPDGVAVVRALCRRSDVVLESFRPGVAARLGIDAATVLGDNPGVVYCSMSGYGQDGPRADAAGHDLNYLATGGLLGTMVGASGDPTLPGAPVADFTVGALHAVVGVLAALREREVLGGAGRVVDVSVQEGVAHLVGPMVVEYLETGQPPDGFLHGVAPWYAVYRTADGRHLAVAAVEPWFFANLCRELGHPEWSDCHLDRDRWPQVRAEMAAVFAGRTAKEWLEALAGVDACVSAVHGIADLPDDPQLAHRGLFRRRADDPRRWETAPVPHLRGMPAEARRPASRPGQHTDELLAELGFGPQEVRRLRAVGAVG